MNYAPASRCVAEFEEHGQLTVLTWYAEIRWEGPGDCAIIGPFEHGDEYVAEMFAKGPESARYTVLARLPRIAGVTTH